MHDGRDNRDEVLHLQVTGMAETRTIITEGSRAQHAVEEAERSEAASVARSAREDGVAAATPSWGIETGRPATARCRR